MSRVRIAGFGPGIINAVIADAIDENLIVASDETLGVCRPMGSMGTCGIRASADEVIPAIGQATVAQAIAGDLDAELELIG